MVRQQTSMVPGTHTATHSTSSGLSHVEGHADPHSRYTLSPEHPVGGGGGGSDGGRGGSSIGGVIVGGDIVGGAISNGGGGRTGDERHAKDIQLYHKTNFSLTNIYTFT